MIDNELNICGQDFVEKFGLIFMTIGILFSFAILFKVLFFIYQCFFVFLIMEYRHLNLKKFGKWALIIGGNSGIGKSYAKQMAKNGMNILIVGRTLNTLKTTIEEIKSLYNVQCNYVQMDLVQRELIYTDLKKKLRDRDIGIVVISAGIAGNAPCDFLDETDSNIISIIELHIRAVLKLIYIILPSILRKKAGIIVVISSFLSLFPTPKSGIYSSSKAFSDRLIRGISWEYKTKNIYIQSLIPYTVSTRMIAFFQESIPFRRFTLLSSDTFCSSAIKTVGFKYYTTGHWKHEILLYLVYFLPNCILKFIIEKLLNYALDEIKSKQKLNLQYIFKISSER